MAETLQLLPLKEQTQLLWPISHHSEPLEAVCKNLELGGRGEVPPLLDHVVPVHVTELQPEFTDDVVFLESVEVKNLHDHC